ncbi:uncharacterized protein LAESUDRAFT_710785 [Laetiporus sulphureus 93-53]|uniref:Uncharacterized protein n=1 Tax=Laetiporus sulphureus 93-53 TaxID=1314785 RepID=A0A165H3L0_9APHY|nr:uncharacterized protein LAESUDRAFT_710785 [Laetiporus sulphureus 93-53]KZT11197.1 hypothetical protein LAESUDRAFT_710785 [Laetiporus sulphureus 93-53]
MDSMWTKCDALDGQERRQTRMQASRHKDRTGQTRSESRANPQDAVGNTRCDRSSFQDGEAQARKAQESRIQCAELNTARVKTQGRETQNEERAGDLGLEIAKRRQKTGELEGVKPDP